MKQGDDGTTASHAKEEIDPARRAALKAVARYAGVAAGTTVVIMTPDEALSKRACSLFNNSGANGCG